MFLGLIINVFLGLVEDETLNLMSVAFCGNIWGKLRGKYKLYSCFNSLDGINILPRNQVAVPVI